MMMATAIINRETPIPTTKMTSVNTMTTATMPTVVSKVPITVEMVITTSRMSPIFTAFGIVAENGLLT